MAQELTLEDVAKDEEKWRRMAIYLGARGDDVDEMIQRMYLKLGEIQHKKGSLEDMRGSDGINTFYVFKTLQSCIVDEYRNKKTISSNTLEVTTDRIELAHDLHSKKEKKYRDLMLEMKRVINNLDDYDLMMLELYYVKGCTIREIASGINMSTKSVFNTLSNIKRELRNEIKEEFKTFIEAEKDTQEINRIGRCYREDN